MSFWDLDLDEDVPLTDGGANFEEFENEFSIEWVLRSYWNIDQANGNK